MTKSDLSSAVAIGCIFVITHMIAISLATPFQQAGFQAFENPDDPINPIIYIILILVFTFIILMFVKKRKANWIKYILLGAMSITMVYVFFLPFAYLLFYLGLDPNYGIFGAIALSGVLTYLLAVYPEWYIVDGVGISIGAGVTAIIGISFGILPTLILLVALAIYDAISVYKTKHMVTLADAVVVQRLPILLVIPKKLSYTFLEQKGIKEQMAKGEEREAMFMGLGDIIIPGVLVVASFVATNNMIIPICTIIGTLIGFSILMSFVVKGNPQAGLPLLNTGAIIGFVISYMLVFNDLSLGITWPW
jgi:presenilin-like A22 family membrane protease